MSGSVFSPWAQAPLNYGDFLKRLAVLLGLDENVAESVLFEAIVKTDPIQLVQLDLQLVKDDVSSSSFTQVHFIQARLMSTGKVLRFGVTFCIPSPS